VILVISGWDLLKGLPETALRAVPVGSVYWFEIEETDPAGLRDLSQKGPFSV